MRAMIAALVACVLAVPAGAQTKGPAARIRLLLVAVADRFFP